ncbi:MAG: hypothetical protein EOP67_02745 [Sphingomonas sp.]|nr:MAG: hypothetical protein EOP67_02745 [Sphingomonas sp.]
MSAVTVTFLPRQGEVAVRSTDGGGGYGVVRRLRKRPSTTRLRRAVPSAGLDCPRQSKIMPEA